MHDELRALVLDAVRACPGRSGAELAADLRRRESAVQAVVRELLAEGEVVNLGPVNRPRYHPAMKPVAGGAGGAPGGAGGADAPQNPQRAAREAQAAYRAAQPPPGAPAGFSPVPYSAPTAPPAPPAPSNYCPTCGQAVGRRRRGAAPAAPALHPSGLPPEVARLAECEAALLYWNEHKHMPRARLFDELKSGQRDPMAPCGRASCPRCGEGGASTVAAAETAPLGAPPHGSKP